MGRRVGATIRLECGFSMVELLIALAILAVLVGLAVPGMRTLLVSRQVTGALNDLLADLQTARTLAISRTQRVGVVASGGHWQDGWQIQPDGTPSAASYSAASATPLHAHAALGAGFSAAMDRGGAIDRVVFARDGSVYDTASNARASGDTTFGVCKPAGARAQAMVLVVHASGQMQSYRDRRVSGASCP